MNRRRASIRCVWPPGGVKNDRHYSLPVMVLMPRVTIVDADKISDEAAAAVAEVWQTVNGALRVKLHDKHAALVSLGRHPRGGPGCVVHGGTHQSLGKHCESLPAEVRARPDAGSPVRS